MYTLCPHKTANAAAEINSRRYVLAICIMEETVAVTALQFKEAAEKTKHGVKWSADGF